MVNHRKKKREGRVTSKKVNYIIFPVPHPGPKILLIQGIGRDESFFSFSVFGTSFLSSSFEECKLQEHGSVYPRAFGVMRSLAVG